MMLFWDVSFFNLVFIFIYRSALVKVFKTSAGQLTSILSVDKAYFHTNALGKWLKIGSNKNISKMFSIKLYALSAI